jgi:acyl carrier protein
MDLRSGGAVTATDVEARVRRLLEKLAPGAGATTVACGADLRWELDLDSMDMLELSIALGREFGVVVTGGEQGKLATIDGCLAHVATRGP